MAGPVTPNETVPIRQIVINAIISCHPAHTIVGDSDNCVSHLSLNHSMPYWPMSFSLSICVIWCAPCTRTHTHTHRYCTISTKCSRGVTCHHKCSFLGNHGKVTIYGSPANAKPNILAFFFLPIWATKMKSHHHLGQKCLVHDPLSPVT
jgi:hypothetical protein